MTSPNNTNLFRDYFPEPPITVSGDSIDSGLGPSIDSTDFDSGHGWSDKALENAFPIQRSIETPWGNPSDLIGISQRYYFEEYLIPQDLDLPRPRDRVLEIGLREMQQLSDAVSETIPSLNHTQLLKLHLQLEVALKRVDGQLRAPFPPRNEPTHVDSSERVFPRLEAFRCPLCEGEDTTYWGVAFFEEHLQDMHDVQQWQYYCPEPQCIVTKLQRVGMEKHLRDYHEQIPSSHRIVNHRIEHPCPPFCKICSQPTAEWIDFYKHADNHLMHINLLDEDKGVSATHAMAELGQKRKHEDENKHSVGQNLSIPSQCTSCTHNLAECRTCCRLSGSIPSCHICYNPPAHDTGACVAATIAAYSDGTSLLTAILDRYHRSESTWEIKDSLALGCSEIQSQYTKYYDKAGTQYKEGDSLAREQMKDIIIALQVGMLGQLRRAQTQGTTLDLVALQIESEQGRVRTLVILEDLYHRLSGSFTLLPHVATSLYTDEDLRMEDPTNAVLPHVIGTTPKEWLSRETEPQDSILHEQSQVSLCHASGSLAEFSIETKITIPELEEDSIDAGIPGTKNMDHILDADRYFSELDQLEVQTAHILGMKSGPYIKLESLDDCIECLGNWQAALEYLKSQGFCGTTVSILIEDQDREGIANAFHVSLSQVGVLIKNLRYTLDKQDLLKMVTKRWMHMLFNFEDNPLSDSDSVESLRFLCTILSIGIVSFSGSHVCRFDINLWGQEKEDIPIGFDGYTFRPRKLACLDDFIGGPAWILGKASPLSEGMKISFTVQDLQELWGPVSLVGGSADEAPLIKTERGFIAPLPLEQQSYLSTSSLGDEIECHWIAEITEHRINESSDTTILIRKTSRILIGTTTDFKAGLVVNDKCKSSISLIGQQIACRFQYPGTSKSRYVSDGYDVQLGGGQFVTAGLMKKYKRIPKRTLKAMLVADCKKPDTRLAPLLNIRVGLEVSACTGNAQRVTLWDALRFSQTSTQPTDHSMYCAHKVGDMKCISTCWTRWQSMDDIDSLGHIPGQNKLLSVIEARRVIINSIIALEYSGVDSEGNLQVSWPFSDSPANCLVLPSTPRGSHNWFRVIKDTRDTSCFAVFSQRCLEFPEEGMMRSCSAPCKERHSRSLQTTLSTRILTPAEEGSVSGLLVGVKFQVGEAHLTVTKAVQDQLAMIATVSMNPLSPLRYRLREILPDARASDYKEHIWSDITTGLSVPVFVH